MKTFYTEKENINSDNLLEQPDIIKNIYFGILANFESLCSDDLQFP